MANAASDRTVNKVALCSAIFAGVAYIGYSVVKQAFGKTFSRGEKKKEGENALLENNSHRRKRIYLRRLSGTGISSNAAEVFLRNQDSSEKSVDPEGSNFIFRPLSVQQRIKELNLRARHFAETVLAVQLHDGYDRSSGNVSYHGRAISLQPSPIHTPRPLSPIDITNLGSSRCSSVENLSLTSPPQSFTNGSLRRRWSRSSRRKLFNKSSETINKEDLDDEADQEAERLLDEREAELSRRLQGFENGTVKVLTPYEAKSLVALLHSKDCDTLERVLVTISNSAAFTANQDHLREAGCLTRLQNLLSHSDFSVKLAAIRTCGNLALNVQNQKEMENFVPLLLRNVDSSKHEQSDGVIIVQTLSTLTNITALEDWHQKFDPYLERILMLTESTNQKIQLQALRLLINLSTNDQMIPSLIKKKALDHAYHLMEDAKTLTEDQLLRIVTFLSNLVRAGSRLNVINFHSFQNGHHSPEDFSINSKLQSPNFLSFLSDLMSSHPNDDIRNKAKYIRTVLAENNNDRDSA